MSARKLDLLKNLIPLPTQTRLTLSANAVRIRKNGIEFSSTNPIAAWTEMTVELQSARDDRQVRCTGVVVACNGARSNGYTVSLLFTNLSPQSEAVLSSLAYSRLD